MEAYKAKTLASFSIKYPNADLNKFDVDVIVLNEQGDMSGDIYFINGDDWIGITTDKFTKNPKFVKYLTSIQRYPKMWRSGGKIQPLPKGKYHKAIYYLGMKTGDAWYDGYPEKNILNYPVSNFRIYVSERKYFFSKLPVLKILTYNGEKWDDKLDYFRVVFATYCASYCCGVSLQHLTPSAEVDPVITSIMRFHVYFTIRRLVRRMEGGESMKAISREFDGGSLYHDIKKIPRKHHYQGYTKDGVTGEKVVYTLNSIHSDYKMFIPTVSEGFTNIGRQYINQSIEAFVYSVLGAQAKTRVSIVSNTAGALETQQEFRKLVEDSVVNYDVSTWILNMNKAIMDTKVIQNLALSPSTWLIPGGLIILKNPISGYNNVLKTATEYMKFGLNDGINYSHVVIKPKKSHIGGGEHLETLDTTPKVTKVHTITPVVTSGINISLIVATTVIGALISKFII